MKKDASRYTFHAEKHYRLVLMQQGRVQLDADWNEQGEIIENRVETETRDTVGLCGAPIEDHRAGPDTRWTYIPGGGVVGIPFRTLVVRDAVNVLVAGRCFSATHDAHASVRSMAQCMAMGQAAGTAAAMAATSSESAVRSVAPTVLRSRLAADGAILELPGPVPTPLA